MGEDGIASVDETTEVFSWTVVGTVVTLADNVVVSAKKNQNKSFSYNYLILITFISKR